jgi:DNA repair exonuclease SbcCD ATPase subunit
MVELSRLHESIKEQTAKYKQKELELQQEQQVENYYFELEKESIIIDRARLKLDELRRSKTEVSVNTKFIFDRIDGYKSLESKKCPKCEQEVSEDHIEGLVKELEAQACDFIPRLEQITLVIEEQEKILQLEKPLKSKLDEIRVQLSSFKHIKQELEQISGYVKLLEQTRVLCKQEIERVKNKVNTFNELIVSKEEDSKKLENERGLLIQERDSLRFEVDKYNVLKDVFRNIKYYVFETVVGELNDKVNRYVSTLFDTDVQVKFDTQTTTTTKEVKQKFSTTIIKDDIERSYESLSGGEKKRIELSTNFALSDIIANRSNKTFNMILLDECFEGLDIQGRERVVHLLEELKNDRENVFIIDHYESIRNLVDNEIKVTKINGVSSIEQ